MQLRVLSWNLFHGRDFAPDPALHTWRSRILRLDERNATHLQVNRDLLPEFSGTLARAEWDVAALQECPPRWASELARATGAEAHLALTSRNSLGALRATLAQANPDLIASNEGGSNLTLVRPPAGRIEDRGERELRAHPERRALALTRLGPGVVVANLHASTADPNAAVEVALAARDAIEWAGERPHRPRRRLQRHAGTERRVRRTRRAGLLTPVLRTSDRPRPRPRPGRDRAAESVAARGARGDPGRPGDQAVRPCPRRCNAGVRATCAPSGREIVPAEGQERDRRRSGWRRPRVGRRARRRPAERSASPRRPAERSASPRRRHRSSARPARSDKSVQAFRDELDRSLTLSRDRLQEVFDDAVKRGRMTRDDANELVSSLVTRGRQASDDMIRDLEKLIEQARKGVESRVDPARQARQRHRGPRLAHGARRGRSCARRAPTRFAAGRARPAARSRPTTS